MLKRFFKAMFPTSVIASTDGLDILGWKYMPHFIAVLCALVGLYWLMGWELP